MITVVEYNKEQKQITVHEHVNWKNFKTIPEHLYWWDLSTPTREENDLLSERFKFHPLAIEDCIAEIHYPKIDFYENYLYLVVHGVDVDLSEREGFAPKELDIFLGKDYLVTYHDKEARSVNEVLRRCKENTPIFEYGLDFVLYTILDILVANYVPVLESIEENLEEVEEIIFGNPEQAALKDILAIKRTLMRLKKTVFPQREVINHLARNEYEFVQPRTQAYFRDVYDMLYRMAEMTESFRDVSTAMVETYLSTVSNRMNQVMKVLTLITTIFLPLTLIAGIYGMNFQYMPELHWKYGYPFALGIMVIVAMSLVGFFKWKKWL
jgi:magnesium transporter